MKKRCAALLAAALLLLCGCDRSVRTDVVLFCEAFNERAKTLRIREENVCFRESGEALLYAGGVLIRLQTTDDNAVHTAVVTADAANLAALREAAECAFACLAEPFSDRAPEEFLRQIDEGTDVLYQAGTKHFLYLLYRTDAHVTVLQWNSRLSEIPSTPALHPSGSE